MAEDSFTITLERREGFRFDVDFGVEGVPPLLMDEPEPLGDGSGPNAARVLAAAVGNCLTASALYCLQRARIEVGAIRTTVSAQLERNEKGRLRVGGLDVRIEPEVAEEDRPRMKRCLELFEDFCVVTASVRRGVQVDVSVEPTAPAAA